MKFSSRRDLREKLYRAFSSKGFQDNDNNNETIVLEIVNLRQQRAQILGYKNHAAYVLEERMAKSPAAVKDFLNTLLEKALPAAKRELKELSTYAKENLGISDLQKWDSAYVSEKLRQQRFNFEEELLKPYLALDNCVKGIFEVARKLFGLRFESDSEIPVYHSEVSTYKVYDENDKFVSYFYTDFHPRPGKRDGAWMTSFRSQYTENPY